MVGVSMAITIIICVAAFIWIYLRVGPFLSDFIPAKSHTLTPVTQAAPAATPSAATSASTATATATAPAAVATPAVLATPTPTFQATYQLSADVDVYLRSGPTTASSPVTVLKPGAQLQFLGDQQQTGPTIWMHFKTADGDVGWVRQIDVSPLSP